MKLYNNISLVDLQVLLLFIIAAKSNKHYSTVKINSIRAIFNNSKSQKQWRTQKVQSIKSLLGGEKQ